LGYYISYSCIAVEIFPFMKAQLVFWSKCPLGRLVREILYRDNLTNLDIFAQFRGDAAYIYNDDSRILRMNIIKWLAVLAVIGLLVAPGSALPLQSVHIEKVCPLMSGGCNSAHAMKCTGKCPNDSDHSQGSTCQISLFSSIAVSDAGYSYFGKGSSSPLDKESFSASSSRFVNGSILSSPSQVNTDGIGPPDLDVIKYLPPSAKLIFDVLESDGPLTQKEIISKTDLPPTTVRYALGKLKGEYVIKECFYFPDARQSLYGLNTATCKCGRE